MYVSTLSEAVLQESLSIAVCARESVERVAAARLHTGALLVPGVLAENRQKRRRLSLSFSATVMSAVLSNIQRRLFHNSHGIPYFFFRHKNLRDGGDNVSRPRVARSRERAESGSSWTNLKTPLRVPRFLRTRCLRRFSRVWRVARFLPSTGVHFVGFRSVSGRPAW